MNRAQSEHLVFVFHNTTDLDGDAKVISEEFMRAQHLQAELQVRIFFCRENKLSTISLKPLLPMQNNTALEQVLILAQQRSCQRRLIVLSGFL